MPDFTGVPGEIVSIEGLSLSFGQHMRTSPYDPLLDKLVEAGQGKALRFGDPKARASVGVRAKKKGLKVSFALAGGALYVRLDGHVDDDVRLRRRTGIMTALKVGGSRTRMQLTTFLRDKGDATVDAQLVGAVLIQMAREGVIVQGEGDTWSINPAKRVA